MRPNGKAVAQVSGHSKWKTIKHKKGATDAKRGVLFTKLSRDITLAAKLGGGSDPDMNYQLRLAIDKAKTSNMPTDNIERAVKRGLGEGEDQEQLEGVLYEGYGPGGAAIMLHAITSNRNRTASSVRSTFSKSGANLGESGCVAWNFETKGIITLEANQAMAEDIALSAIDAGAEDVSIEQNFIEVFTAPSDLIRVRQSLEAADVPISNAELSMVPKVTVELDDKQAEQTLRLLDLLEDLEDAQKVYTNADFSDDVLEKYRGEG